MKSKAILSSSWAFVQVAEALRERAQRIYEKYGNVMLETEGMTKAGIERKDDRGVIILALKVLTGIIHLAHPHHHITCPTVTRPTITNPAFTRAAITPLTPHMHVSSHAYD